ncbi:MAG: UDP-N-acetylmuramate dehydrogenase, partial [Ruminococcaceae bacterium]|nr:UDP-N-acetylmuramate dehydrogenase [Oscillospiraceae bacterium]
RQRSRIFAGVPLPLLAAKMRDRCLSGAEFASGIPATVGGAVVMNAGAHGGQMSDILVESIAYDTERGETVRLTAEENRLSYRHSIYLERRELICLGAAFFFCNGDKSAISELMDKNNNARKSSQPLELPSAGSFFKRPKDHFAAKLIDDCGLKGYRVGGACISEKHAGFIVNLGGATAEDVLAIAEYARKTVFEKTGIELSREVELVE